MKNATHVLNGKMAEVTQAMEIPPASRYFSLPLEDFDVERFITLLNWLNISDYRFTCVVHHNKDGGYGIDQQHCAKRVEKT